MIYSNVNLRADSGGSRRDRTPLASPSTTPPSRGWKTSGGPLNRIVTKVPLPGRDVSDLGADEYLYFDRSRVLKKAAAEVSTRLGVDLPWAPLELSILEYDPERGTESGAAREHTFCRRQGRCIFGCLPGARETLDRSLFDHVLSSPDAGATLLPMAEVTGLRRIDGGYEGLVSRPSARRGGVEGHGCKRLPRSGNPRYHGGSPPLPGAGDVGLERPARARLLDELRLRSLHRRHRPAGEQRRGADQHLRRESRGRRDALHARGHGHPEHGRSDDRNVNPAHRHVRPSAAAPREAPAHLARPVSPRAQE